MSYLLAFLGFALLIILHEAGHFAAAKATGMRVERFSLFFGPMFLKRQWGETEYGVGPIPLGGYVKITGMSPLETFETPEIEARAYINQPVWKRIVVIAAGPAVNIALAFVLFWAFYGGQNQLALNHKGQPIVTNQVVGVMSGTAAAGVLHVGDVLVSVDGVRGDFETLRKQIETHRCAGRTTDGCEAATAATLVVRRDGVLRSLRVKPRYSSADKEMLVGFEFGEKTVPTSVAAAAGLGVSALWRVTSATVSDLVQIFKPQDRKQIHSIVGAYTITQQAVAAGGDQAIGIFGLISLALGVINLFPFLPLDGGHIFWALVEKVRGRKVPIVVMERAGIVGIALILGIVVIGLSNDITGLSNGSLNIH